MLRFSFDLEKTLPIPYINTSVAYYKRKLWLYNLGINTCHNNKAYMCVWDETNGKRGSNEVSSLILPFFKKIYFSRYEEIYSFSDCCGGQNCNKNIISFMMCMSFKPYKEVDTHFSRIWSYIFAKCN